MTDFWFSFLWTLLVTAATLVADWMSGTLVAYARGLRAIRTTVEQSLADQSKVAQIRAHLQALQRRKELGLLWGVDLAMVTLALDFSALGLWITNKTTFPFFLRYDTPQANRQIAVWLLVLTAHFLLLLVSVAFRHFHGERVEPGGDSLSAKPRRGA